MTDHHTPPASIIRRSLRYKGRNFSVFEYEADIGGKVLRRDIIERAHGVVAVPIDVDHNVYLISEYCAGANSFVLSLPGGKATSADESIMATEAQRELEEETGLIAKQMIKLRFSYSHPSTSTRKSYTFLAYDVVQQGKLDRGPDELIEIVRVPLDEAIDMVMQDFLSDVSTIGNLLMARDKLRGLEL